ncbi:hypothetical protein ABK040_006395 [Willaertia magna]
MTNEILCGLLLRLNDVTEDSWIVSILLVLLPPTSGMLFHASSSSNNLNKTVELPQLNISKGKIIKVEVLTTNQMLNVSNLGIFVRYLVEIPLMNIRDIAISNSSFEKVEYYFTKTISFSSLSVEKYSFHLPINQQNLHFLFGSCNSYERNVTIWDHINNIHQQQPYHLAVLGGDQIYNDGVFNIPSIKENWLQFKTERLGYKKINKEIYLKTQPTDEIRKDIENFYFNNYLNIFGHKMKRFYSSIICISLADDHDYYDGKGSYDDCPPMMQCIDKIATQFILLFQYHMSFDDLFENKQFFNRNALNICNVFYSFGISIMMIDTRSERTINQFVSKGNQELIRKKLMEVAKMKQVQKIYFVTGVPIIFPAITKLRKLVDVLFNTSIDSNSILPWNFTKESLRYLLNLDSPMGTLEARDDLIDHWSDKNHLKERDLFLEMLLEVVLKHKKQLTLLGGDVHTATSGSIKDKKTKNVLISQIVSSAFTSTPPPKRIQDIVSRTGSEDITIQGKKYESITFGVKRNGKIEKLLERGNWTDINCQISQNDVLEVKEVLYTLTEDGKELEIFDFVFQ